MRLPYYFKKSYRLWDCPIRVKNEWFGKDNMNGNLCKYDHDTCKGFKKSNFGVKNEEAVLHSVFDSTKRHCKEVQREFFEDCDGRWFFFHRALMLFLELRCNKCHGSVKKKGQDRNPKAQ